MINDILDFSRIEARKLDLESVDFDLRDSLGDTLRSLALRARPRGWNWPFTSPRTFHKP